MRIPRTCVAGGPLGSRLHLAALGALLAIIAGCGSDSTSSNGGGGDDSNNVSSLAFDADDNSYVDMGTSADFAITGPMTLEAWVKCDTQQDNDFNRFIDKFSFTLREGYNLILNGGHLFMEFFAADGSNQSVYGDRNIQDGRWHHVAGTYDGQDLRIYIDGNLDNVETVGSHVVSVSSNPLTVGSGNDGGGFLPLNGRIDEVRVWNIARTAAQIAGSMDACLDGDEPGLVGYWRFDENEGVTALDETANGNDGTFVNMPTWATDTGFLCP